MTLQPGHRPYEQISPDVFYVQQFDKVYHLYEKNPGICSLKITFTEEGDRAILSTSPKNIRSGKNHPTAGEYIKQFSSTEELQFIDKLHVKFEDNLYEIEVPFIRLDKVLENFGILKEARDAAQDFVKKMLD